MNQENIESSLGTLAPVKEIKTKVMCVISGFFIQIDENKNRAPSKQCSTTLFFFYSIDVINKFNLLERQTIHRYFDSSFFISFFFFVFPFCCVFNGVRTNCGEFRFFFYFLASTYLWLCKCKTLTMENR